MFTSYVSKGRRIATAENASQRQPGGGHPRNDNTVFSEYLPLISDYLYIITVSSNLSSIITFTVHNHYFVFASVHKDVDFVFFIHSKGIFCISVCLWSIIIGSFLFSLWHTNGRHKKNILNE